MPDLVPTTVRDLFGPTNGAHSMQPMPRQTARSLERIEARTVLDVAEVQSRGVVATAMSREIAHNTRDAMTSIAMLRRWGDVHVHGDPFLADDMRFFGDIAKMGMGEVIANLVDSYCDHGRRR